MRLPQKHVYPKSFPIRRRHADIVAPRAFQLRTGRFRPVRKKHDVVHRLHLSEADAHIVQLVQPLRRCGRIDDRRAQPLKLCSRSGKFPLIVRIAGDFP